MTARKEPTAPTIAPTSVATKLFVRAYAEPRQQRRYHARQALKVEQREERSARSARAMFDGTIFVYDTETFEHSLTFGGFEEWRGRKLVARAVFHADTLPTDLVQAESPRERARATISAKLIGLGPEFVDPDRAHYQLELTIYVKPGPGHPTGNVQTIRAQDDFYGPGRPGISEQAVQSAVINELIRVARIGK
jgi:hypothetical protein